jgi:hypothetical protein
VCETARRRSEHAKEAVIALNPDRIGHRYPTYHYEVGREKIREYAAATGVHDEIYRSDPLEVPTSELLAPPTFATCFTIGGVRSSPTRSSERTGTWSTAARSSSSPGRSAAGISWRAAPGSSASPTATGSR